MSLVVRVVFVDCESVWTNALCMGSVRVTVQVNAWSITNILCMAFICVDALISPHHDRDI
jgi:hypothetical protein